ncbi:hypothetical protein F9U64_15435 [Gracilibacillus oryzae]|uniref:Uncharacterized protein n=1 Tax=Gracilibacillus oryzae TaxID=1672701 RepID=A0A7C8GSI6_9BACI|nr:hypothetical protein [Gracilibacillus oryzae]KAB8129177.1 hypothetical protein F9U64_15435 [Gracilibacillus oryzae]
MNGVFEKNKIYYGNLIESKLNAIKDAEAEGDQDKVELWENSLQDAIEDFNQAPGIVPYIVGLNHNADMAAKYGVEEPADDFFDSKYNAAMVLDQGKFEANHWSENAIFQEDEELKAHVQNLVADKFEDSEQTVNETVQVAAEQEAEPAAAEEKVTASSLTENANKELSLHQYVWDNLKESIKPNIFEVIDKYKLG